MYESDHTINDIPDENWLGRLKRSPFIKAFPKRLWRRISWRTTAALYARCAKAINWQSNTKPGIFIPIPLIQTLRAWKTMKNFFLFCLTGATKRNPSNTLNAAAVAQNIHAVLTIGKTALQSKRCKTRFRRKTGSSLHSGNARFFLYPQHLMDKDVNDNRIKLRTGIFP